MGLLDDAIREHLELKRHHGAEAEELSRLEKEAFSPPSRPGDPDFGPDPEESSEGGEATEPADQGDRDDGPPSEEMTGAEHGRSEHSNLDDTVPHPVTDEDAAVSAEEPPEAPESAIFAGEDDLEIDLDLEIDDEVDLGTPQAAPPAPTSEPGSDQDDDFLADADFEAAFDLEPDPAPEAAPERVRVDDPLETGEQPAPLTPKGEPLEEGELLEEEPAEQEGAADEENEAEDDGEDLLEETPDFLKEAPDGESLWFEQGKPKDFDFGDDD